MVVMSEFIKRIKIFFSLLFQAGHLYPYQNGFAQMGIILFVVLIVAAGVMIFNSSSGKNLLLPATPLPTTSFLPSLMPSSPTDKVVGPTPAISVGVGGPVSPGIFEGDLRKIPTTQPLPSEYMRPISDVSCQTTKDCSDETGRLKGICSVPCMVACVNNKCINNAPPGAVCLSQDTSIDTPLGPIAVQKIREGTSVWTVDKRGNRQVAKVMKISKTAVSPAHKIVHLVFADGKELFVSPGHPTADRRLIGNLKPGDILHGIKVVSTELIPYKYPFTYDLLPEGETGFYFANGILLGSTIKL